MSKCPKCNSDFFSKRKMILLGFGSSCICAVCHAKVKVHWLAQFTLAVFLTLVTVILLVLLGNLYGLAGVVAAFLIPLALDVVVTNYLPLEEI